MILGFSFADVMRLSSIKRWGIVEMSRPQSVAEHSYNVAMVTLSICNRIGVDESLAVSAMTWALLHDLPEVVTGDIPTSLKQESPGTFEELESRRFPIFSAAKTTFELGGATAITKIADYVDAIQFAQKFCVDDRKHAIIEEMKGRMASAIEHLGTLVELPDVEVVDPKWLG